jgi:hypothetical protein
MAFLAQSVLHRIGDSGDQPREMKMDMISRELRFNLLRGTEGFSLTGGEEQSSDQN